MNRDCIVKVIEALRAGEKPLITVEDAPAFAQKGNPYLTPDALDALCGTLGPEDIPTFERALEAIEAKELAWLGFKLVFDGPQALSNTDNEVTKKYGDVGSADDRPLVFFCNEAKEIVASREPSPRDLFQMKDVTRGPSMHNEQFEGLIWASASLFDPIRVWLLGASDVASELADLALHVGFDVTVVDYDPSYVNEKRFPNAKRIELPGDTFDGLADLDASPDDYVCVLTRGHMFDPQGCLWGARHGAHYIGMMGCAGKNNTVYDLCKSNGMSDEQWDAIKRPIGLKFGAKTPAELAIAIVAELIDVRYRQRFSEEERLRHDKSIGR